MQTVYNIILQVYPVAALKDNYIWMIVHPDSTECIVVDPGDANPVINFLHHHHLKLHAIFLTHHHWDHTNGVNDLLKREHVPVIAGHHSPHEFVSHRMKEGEKIRLLDVDWQVMEIPGHTLDHVAYIGNNKVFTGDTLFSAGCGRAFEGTLAQLYASLQRLSQLPKDTEMYCGHEYTESNLRFAQTIEPGNIAIQDKWSEVTILRNESKPTLPSTIGIEHEINVFLRAASLEIFSERRLAKDKF